MGFRLQHRSMTLNDLERRFTALSSVLCVAIKWLKLESRGLHYKVALYHSYLPVKFDDYMLRGSLIWGYQHRVGSF